MTEALIYRNHEKPLGDPEGLYKGGVVLELTQRGQNPNSTVSPELDKAVQGALISAGMSQNEFEEIRSNLTDPQSVVARIPIPVTPGGIPRMFDVGTATISTEKMGVGLLKDKVAVLVAAAVKPTAYEIDIDTVQNHGVMSMMWHRLLDTADPDILTAVVGFPAMRLGNYEKSIRFLDELGFVARNPIQSGLLSKIIGSSAVSPVLLGPRVSVLQKNMEKRHDGIWLPEREHFDFAPVPLAA